MTLAKTSALPANEGLKLALSEKILAFMRAKDINQSEFARRAGLQRWALNSYIKRRSIPGDLALNKIARVMGVPPEALLEGWQGRTLDTRPKAFNIAQSDEPGMVVLTINQIVPQASAFKIMEILNPPDKKG